MFIKYSEGYHNFHHTFPYDYTSGEWGQRMNFSTLFIDLFAALGLVYDRTQAFQETILKICRRKGHLSD